VLDPSTEGSTTVQYMILLYVDANIDARPGAPEWDASLPQHRAFAEAMSERGYTFSGGALHDARTATSVRVRDGERLVTDGPFAETKEQLWGYHLVEAPDLDGLLDACAGLWEAEHGTVEIRPLIPSQAPAQA
jgi:hypothetical protein